MNVSLFLSSTEASNRLLTYGPNEISQNKRRSPLLLFVDQFKSPLVAILLGACVLAGVMGELAETIAIGVVLFINALIGFFQEYRAESAILALQNMTAPRATVVRDGVQVVIPAREVVPGDLLVLEAGDVVAADAQILAASRLSINEAVLTGESFPVEKSIPTNADNNETENQHSFAFMGTAVATGTGRAKVTATGMKTELGKIARLITSAENTSTPLQVQLAAVGKNLLLLCLIVVSLVLLLGFYHGFSGMELAVYAISLAVAAVPEGLPAIVTVALALGVQRMAMRNALVRSLPAVETLGSVTVICTDKTGTLTTGNMRVREVWGDDHTKLLRTAAACCDAEINESDVSKATGDPTEVAILIEALTRGISRNQIEKSAPRVTTEPFDSVRKRMSVYRQDGTLYVKGAVESILPLCGSHSADQAILKHNQDMTSRGLRVLAVATGDSTQETNLTFVGLIGIADPPRTEVQQAISEAREAGIIPVMITGDHPVTAAAVARELGLVLEHETLEGRVHARATPEEKLNLVREWKNRGAIVAMTGDGVNDAPALREAHIGIAMGKTGTEVTRQSADLILADDNFATIVAAVREGRGVYQNIRKAVIYLLTGNFAELALVLGASIFSLPLPLLAPHLLWINIVTDSLPALALIADPVSVDAMKQPPRSPTESILGKKEWIRVTWVGLLESSVILCLFLILLDHRDEVYARNIVFSTFVFSQMFRSFASRSRVKTFPEVGILSNVWLLAVVTLTALLQLLLHYAPLSRKIFGLAPLTTDDLLIMLPVALIPVSVIEIQKLLSRMFSTHLSRS